MNLRHVPLLLLVASASAASSGNVNGFIGMKNLADDHSHTGDHIAWGVYADIRENQSWPLYLAMNYVGSTGSEDGASGFKATGVNNELQAGIKWYLGEDALRFWAGGGLTFLYADLKSETAAGSVSDNDLASGFWAAVGVMMTVNDSVDLGLSYAYSRAKVELLGQEMDMGGQTMGIQAGYRW